MKSICFCLDRNAVMRKVSTSRLLRKPAIYRAPTAHRSDFAEHVHTHTRPPGLVSLMCGSNLARRRCTYRKEDFIDWRDYNLLNKSPRRTTKKIMRWSSCHWSTTACTGKTYQDYQVIKKILTSFVSDCQLNQVMRKRWKCDKNQFILNFSNHVYCTSINDKRRQIPATKRWKQFVNSTDDGRRQKWTTEVSGYSKIDACCCFVFNFAFIF